MHLVRFYERTQGTAEQLLVKAKQTLGFVPAHKVVSDSAERLTAKGSLADGGDRRRRGLTRDEPETHQHDLTRTSRDEWRAET